MKTIKFSGQSGSNRNGGLQPSVAGALSLVPGLGQLYNGDNLKGWLFLEVGAINFMILLLILCADSISTGLAQFASNHHFHANYALLKQLGSFKLGHPGATLLFALCLAFIAFSVRDAYDRATNIKNREIYKGHFLELSEATSGSYLAHFALMGALLLLSVFLLIPAPERTQVTEIVFVQQPDTHLIKPPVTHTISTVNAQATGVHKEHVLVRPKSGESHPSQPSASSQQTSPQKPAPKPDVKPQQADAPKPIALKPIETPKPMMPHTGPLPAVRPPAPVPLPNTASAAAPKPLLAFNNTGVATASIPSIQPTAIGAGSFSSNNHAAQSWMSGKSPSGAKGGPSASAPAVDTSSIGGTGTSNAKPTLADTSTGRSGPGKATGDTAGPKPMAARSNGPAPGDKLAVLPKITSPIAPVGSPDGGRLNPDAGAKDGPGSVDSSSHSPEFGGYLAELQRRIRKAWYPPRQPNSKSSIIVFTIGSNGELLSAHLQRSSGDHSMDEAAMQAIKNCAPFRHLPQYSPDSVDVQFTFDYNVFSGGRAF